MAAKRKPATKKAPAKKPAAKKTALSAAGAARAEGRKRNRELRESIEALSPVQLKNLLKGVNPATISHIGKALGKIDKEKTAEELKTCEKEQEAIQKRIEELRKKL